LGLIPAVISPFVMAKIGRGNAARYFLTGQKFDAAEANRIGLLQAHHKTVDVRSRRARTDALHPERRVDRGLMFGVCVVCCALLLAQELDATVNSTLREVVDSAPGAVRTCKTLIERVSALATTHGLAAPEVKRFTSGEIARLRVGPEGQDGLQSFFEKRAPKWKLTK
jgi:methylglutaconyl-CoA hydratase